MANVPPEDKKPLEPLKYQTWILKVSIHCEGCKRKVKRILHTVDGVYAIDIDAKQHRVTVTGNVDSNTLLKKLEKSGKHAELLPDSEKIPGKSKTIKDPSSHDSEEQSSDQGIQQSPTVESKKVAVEDDEQPPESSGDEPEISNLGKGNNVNNTQEQPVKAVDEKKAPPPPGNNAGEITGGGSGVIKKKKKGHKGNNTATTATTNNGETESTVAQPQQPNFAPRSTESPPPPTLPVQDPTSHPNPDPFPVNMIPLRHDPNYRVYEHPPTDSAPPPVYGVSYNTAYPSYTASYYSAPPPYSFSYVHGAAEVDPPPPSDWTSASSQPSDTFEMFSDENPNACSVM